MTSDAILVLGSSSINKVFWPGLPLFKSFEYLVQFLKLFHDVAHCFEHIVHLWICHKSPFLVTPMAVVVDLICHVFLLRFPC